MGDDEKEELEKLAKQFIIDYEFDTPPELAGAMNILEKEEKRIRLAVEKLQKELVIIEVIRCRLREKVAKQKSLMG